MKVTWVVASAAAIKSEWYSSDSMKKIGPVWGSWKTWRNFNTDNVVCHDLAKSKDLLGRAFQAVCNFYVYRPNFQNLGRPIGINLYDGDYTLECTDIEDIISLHLASVNTDMVLLLGFDFSKPQPMADPLDNHLVQNRHGMQYSIIKNSKSQWVAIDHDHRLDQNYELLPNFTRDTMSNVLRLLT